MTRLRKVMNCKLHRSHAAAVLSGFVSATLPLPTGGLSEFGHDAFQEIRQTLTGDRRNLEYR